MTVKELIKALQLLGDDFDLNTVIDSRTCLRANGLLTPNKTEREYYKYQEKKEWLTAQRIQVNTIKMRRIKNV